MCPPPGHQSPIRVLVTSRRNAVHDTSIHRIAMIWMIDSNRKDRHTMAGLRKKWQIHNLAAVHFLTFPTLSLCLVLNSLITHKIPLATVNCALQSKSPKPWSSLVCQLCSRHSRIMYCYSHEQMQDTRGAVAFEGTALWLVRKCCLL